MTRVKATLFVSILLVAASMIPGGAHLLEMPAKLGLSRDDYFAVQQIYRGWAWSGVVIFAALASTITLAVLTRRHRAACYLSAASAACIALSLVVFFTFTFPTNQITVNWTVMPDDWATLRRQWEYGHAAGALLYFAAFVSVTLAALSERS